MKVNYTPDQQKAITAKGQNIIVSAGAGSGKTQVLTARVVHFIKNEGYTLDEFLILTFTNLAAAEMKERIRKALKKENLSDYRKVDTASICTFDSYALSLVKSYHLMLKVSKDIAIIDTNLIEVRKRTILNDIFEGYYEQEDETFCQMIEHFCYKDDADIKKLILKIYQKAILANDTSEYLDSFTKNYFNETLINEITNDLYNYIKTKSKLLKSLIENLSFDCLSAKDPRPLRIVVEDLFTQYFNASTYDELITNFPFDLGIKQPNKMLETDKEKYKKFKDQYDKFKVELKTLPKTKAEIETKIMNNLEYAEKMIEIIKILDQKINAYKTNYQVYEFSDIAKMALKLVKENPEVKAKIKDQLKMIMIDEYQDTSFLQEAFINEIASNNVYMVGDVKQSIYRFRNARCDIFVDKYEQYKNKGQGLAIDLKKNFRSRKEVLDDINYIFKNIMTKNCGGAAYQEDHLIEFGNLAYQEARPTNLTHSEFLIYNPDDKADDYEARLIAKDIITKMNQHYQVMTKDETGNPSLRDCTYSDFCILMDRGTNFEQYLKVFNEYQIPLFVEQDENIASTAIVLILINLLKVVKGLTNKEPFDTYKKAYISLARSFLYNKTDEEIYQIITNHTYYKSDVINDISNILYDTKAYPFVIQFEQLIFRLDIYHKCIKLGDVTKNEKYLDTLINLFTNLSHLDYTVDDLIDYLEKIDEYDLKITLSSTGSNINSVKLMNIHKSKGLEFNIVYYSGLNARFNQSEIKEGYNISEHYGLILPTAEDETDFIKLLNKEQELKEDLSEHIRLFYVALTRAKEKMIFVYPEAMKQDKQVVNLEGIKIDNEEENSSTNLNELDIILMQKNLGKSNHDFAAYQKATKLLGYEITPLGCKNLKKLLNNPTDAEIIDIYSIPFKKYYMPIETTDDINNQLAFPGETLLKKIYHQYVMTNLNHDELITLINVIDFEEDIDFKMLNESEKKQFNLNDIDMIFVEKPNFKLEDANCFQQFITPFKTYRKFNSYTYQEDYQPKISVSNSSVSNQPLIVEPLIIENVRKEIVKASKKIDITASKKLMDFGTTIHQILEMIDFNQPNYDLITNQYFSDIIKRFLSSPLLTNVKNAKIIKEYEFIDEVNQTRGIIDLMLLYEDHLDIIDYKTKNIDDNAYNLQLNVYYDYMRQITNQPINIYLYSLLTGEIKQVK